MCGDLCVTTMRHNEYILEKNRYAEPKFIQKQDNKYKKSHPLVYRFHLFVKLQIISINNNVAVVNCKEISELIQNVSKLVSNLGLTEESKKKHDSITLQNMDSYFFLNENRKKKMEKQLQLYQCPRQS